MKLNYQAYHSKIDRIVDYLENNQEISDSMSEKIQAALDALAEQYDDDVELGSERYKMAHAQALIYLKQHNGKKAAQWAQEAMALRGFEYLKAKEIVSNSSPVVEDAEEPVGDVEKDQKPVRQSKPSKLVAEIGAALVVLASAVISRHFGIYYLLTAIPIYAGYFLGKKFARKFNPGVLKSVALFNLIAWFIPIVGLLLGAFSVACLNDRRLKGWKSYIETLATVSLALSVSNGVFGAINAKRVRLATTEPSTVFAHIFLLTLAILLVWFAIRIHITEKKRSVVHKIGIWFVSVSLVIFGSATGAAVVEAYVTNHTSDSASAGVAVKADDYWRDFKQACANEVLKIPDMTNDDAATYCGCMSDQLSAQFQPEEIERQLNDASPSYNLAVEREKSLCAERTGLSLGM